MSVSVEFENVSRIFGDRAALRGVTCVIPAGGVTAVIGPNGSGKSTFMRIAGLLERPGGGSVGHMGAGGRRLEPGIGLMRRMTYVSQNPVMFNASLLANVEYGLRLRGMPGAESRARAHEAIGAGGLSGLADKKAATLSGGEAQRAALVRAFALRPELALLDEPTANLDPDGVALMEEMILGMNQTGATVVIVTHNLHQARRLAGHVMFIYGGRLVEQGPPEVVFGSPTDPLTIGYVSGEMIY